MTVHRSIFKRAGPSVVDLKIVWKMVDHRDEWDRAQHLFERRLIVR
jgi:hypothetical protein